ncbi:hypothetical protein [Kiloniella sp. b19]|uniref:hypothetical protein n=1 Tax=Kiloniella sp. GXU_MW_B19 TaxID=3141326 RepID=UPI0031D9D4E2
MKKRFLISDQGEVQSWDYKNPIKAVVGFEGIFSSGFDRQNLIEKLGWIAVERGLDQNSSVPREVLNFTFHSCLLTEESITAMTSVVMLATGAVRLTYYDGLKWRMENYHESIGAVARILPLYRESMEAMGREHYIALDKNAQELLTDRGPLSLVMQLWANTSGLLSESVLESFRRIGVLNRSVFIQPDAGYSEPKFVHIGSEIGVYGPEWPHIAVGHPVHEQPDPEYGTWVREAYRQVMETRRPQYLHVDACMTMKDGNRCHNRYRCLRLPWKSETGDLILMGTSVITPNVDIPFVTPKNFKL